ncbi:hypothetical protein LY76DRAFT_57065 [Colletotrichum caudatum]|nr:hypothetical protein LY76DRAFT_57065 [Colletotrichum caudatum]
MFSCRMRLGRFCWRIGFMNWTDTGSDDASRRLSQAGELQGPVLQPASHRTPILKGRARVQLGRNPIPSERQLVKEFQSPNDWPGRNHKRRVSFFLSPESIQEDKPEKKRARDKRFEPEPVIDKLQTDGSHGTTAFFQSSNVESQSVMLKHNLNIVSSSNDTRVANASDTDNRLIDRQQTPDGYAENGEDHVKTLHRSMGPMRKRRLCGLA